MYLNLWESEAADEINSVFIFLEKNGKNKYLGLLDKWGHFAHNFYVDRLSISIVLETLNKYNGPLNTKNLRKLLKGIPESQLTSNEYEYWDRLIFGK